MNPRVVGIAGPFQGMTFPLPDGEISIGRDPTNQLCISDKSLSRRHCLIAGGGERFTIKDSGSRNGTLLNGMPVEEQGLRHGDQISVGESVIVFLLHADETQLEKSPVVFADTAELGGSPVVLRPEDSVYLHSQTAVTRIIDPTRQARDLNALLKIATGIGSIRDRESLQWQLLGLIFDVVPADRGAVVLTDNANDFDSGVAWDRVLGPAHPVRVSRTVVRRVLHERVGLVVSDVTSDRTLRSVQTLKDLQVRSLLCVPLLAQDGVLGAIYLDSRSTEDRFDENHLQVMTAVAGIATLAFDNVRRWEELVRENSDLRAEINLEHNMVGSSPRIREVFEFIRRVAPTDSTVLIEGESGTGKELVARAIHRNSPRAERPFIAINCAAITETLLESELFGHEKGAFTGAHAQVKGKMEIAEGGTLFLDEVTELASGLQAKLLRVLQEREFERVGGHRPIKLNIRLVTATNRKLAETVAAGGFRKDLYYRLNVVALTMPALRDRREDIVQLAEYFIAKSARKSGSRPKALSPEARSCLQNYDWPGNVRELENAIERAMVLGSGDVILADDLPETIAESALPVASTNAKYHGALKETKKQIILQALQQAGGNYIDAAKILGMHPNSLLRLIRNLDLKAVAKSGLPPN
ncbi:MAG TPA: sigma 54-interacting transcriptional regulator [Terriglobales bacterium]|nr:sigma 54-interacting transcriptional regulator [Terriglobales bacterium]